MSSFSLLLTASIVIIPFVLLIAFLSWMWMRYITHQNQSRDNLLLTSQNRETDLLNRLMSSDLPTYSVTTGMTSALTTSSPVFNNLIPRDDVTEAERIDPSGLGQALYEEDVAGFQSDLEELGLYVNPDR